MPENASDRSATRPAGPVTATVSPSGVSWASSSRSSATTSPVSASASTSTTTSTARPSSDGMGGETSRTSGTPARSWVAVPIVPSCARVISPCDSMTTMAGMPSESRNSPSRSCTCVACESTGRKSACELEVTSESFPNVGPPTPMTPNHASTSTTGISHRSHPGTPVPPRARPTPRSGADRSAGPAARPLPAFCAPSSPTRAVASSVADSGWPVLLLGSLGGWGLLGMSHLGSRCTDDRSRAALRP